MISGPDSEVQFQSRVKESTDDGYPFKSTNVFTSQRSPCRAIGYRYAIR